MSALNVQLYYACREGDLERVQQLVIRGVDMDTPDPSSYANLTPLHYAAW